MIFNATNLKGCANNQRHEFVYQTQCVVSHVTITLETKAFDAKGGRLHKVMKAVAMLTKKHDPTDKRGSSTITSIGKATFHHKTIKPETKVMRSTSQEAVIAALKSKGAGRETKAVATQRS